MVSGPTRFDSCFGLLVMAKIHRLNNKAGRCGDALAVSCTCGATPCTTICNIDTGEDLDLFFDDLLDCPAPQNCPGTFNGNTFQLTYNAVGGYWQYIVGNTWIFALCFGGTNIVINASSNANGNYCFYANVAADCLTQRVWNQISIREPCYDAGFVDVSIH